MSEIQTKKLLIFHQFGFQSHFCSECVKCKIFVWISDTFVKCLISGHFFEMPDIRTLFWNAWYPDTFLKCLISGHFCLFSCVLNETYKSLDFRHLLYNIFVRMLKHDLSVLFFRLLNESYKRAMGVLKAHRRELDLLAEALLNYETLDAEDIRCWIIQIQ